MKRELNLNSNAWTGSGRYWPAWGPTKPGTWAGHGGQAVWLVAAQQLLGWPMRVHLVHDHDAARALATTALAPRCVHAVKTWRSRRSHFGEQPETRPSSRGSMALGASPRRGYQAQTAPRRGGSPALERCPSDGGGRGGPTGF
jgi:hypothetical protein